ncbi:MAG TPA: hypothetical protein VE978_09475 [Chitinophagales bacterium]|nr:hypothetical protein [Chitinophagales bacterium]
MTETSTLVKESKPRIEIDEVMPPMNGDGMWHDMNLFWRIVKKFRWLFITLFLGVTAISFWYSTYYATYSATAKFTISDWSQAYPSMINNSIYTSDRVNQMLMLFLSDSVVQFLIKKYDMASQLKHPDNIREREELESGVASSISLEPSVFNSFNLKVSTSDPLQSATMANDIINKVIEINRHLYARDLASRIDVIKNLLSTVPGSDTTSGALLASHFSIIQDQLNHLTSSQLSASQMEVIMNELSVLKKQYDDRLVQLKLNELMLKEVSTSGTGSITLIQRAIPDYTDYTMLWLIHALIIATLVCLLFPVVIYLFSGIGEKNRMHLNG